MTKDLKHTTTEQPSKRRLMRREMKTAESIEPAKVNRQNESSQMPEEPIPTSGRVRIRLIPIWLRILIVLILVVSAMILGAIFGYAIIGEGESSDVFKKETWQHIFDIMDGIE